MGLAVIAAADAALIPSAGRLWAIGLCAAIAGAGIGLSSVAATGLGTDVSSRWRGGASGVINTAAQVGTAVGVAVLLLIAAVTSGGPAAGTPPPAAAWAAGAVVAAAGAVRFGLAARDRPGQNRQGQNRPGQNRPGRPRPARDMAPLAADGGDGGEDGLDGSSGVGHHRHVRSSDLGDS